MLAQRHRKKYVSRNLTPKKSLAIRFAKIANFSAETPPNYSCSLIVSATITYKTSFALRRLGRVLLVAGMGMGSARHAGQHEFG